MTPKRLPQFAIGLSVLALSFGVAVQAQTKSAEQPASHAVQKHKTNTHQSDQTHDEGEHIFAQNCSRCHTAPEGFSPRISGTIVRHMRVRAQLSQHDEQELLRFFNP
jgi:cytochrome c5